MITFLVPSPSSQPCSGQESQCSTKEIGPDSPNNLGNTIWWGHDHDEGCIVVHYVAATRDAGRKARFISHTSGMFDNFLPHSLGLYQYLGGN